MIQVTVFGNALELTTVPGLFSPEHADAGTLAMLSLAAPVPGLRVCDLGCGAGLVGIAMAKVCGAQNVLMADIDPQAVLTARENARRNGMEIETVFSDAFSHIDWTGFDLILSNPPYQSDFHVAKTFIEKGFNRLKVGGRMMMVVKRPDWYRNKLRAVFGGVRGEAIDGYFVFTAEKRSPHYANKK